MIPQAQRRMMMTKIIFQFVPRQIGDTSDWDTSSESEIESIHIDEEHHIEFSKFGSIRYVSETNLSSDINIQKIFQEAKESIESEFGTTLENYSACLLITGDRPVITYLEEEDRILEFGESQFECVNPNYSEINDQTVKVSFQKGIRC